MKISTKPFGPCGVFKLRIDQIIKYEDKINIGFKIIEDDMFQGESVFKQFSLKTSTWQLDNFLRNLGLSRKDKAITRNDLIGEELYGAIRINISITEEGKAETKEIFEFFRHSLRDIRPRFANEPNRGEEPKEESNFYQVIDFTKTVGFEQDEQVSDAPQIPC